MGPTAPHVLQALRLAELYRKVCAHAGLAVPPPPGDADARFVVRCGSEPPALFAALLEEALVEDEAEVLLWPAGASPGYGALPAGHVAVRPGFDAPCPVAEELRRALGPAGGQLLLFAVERRDGGGRLLGRTWAAVPEDEPGPRSDFRAAVLRQDEPPPDTLPTA
jgi:hypothetical protein